MQLTGDQIAALGIVYNYDPDKGIQQQGIDVRINTIYSLIGEGKVNLKTKTKLPSHLEVPHVDGELGWHLEPGYYEVDLMEGVDVPDNATLHFKTRSSLVRCGTIVHSGQFDAGFQTEMAGCFLEVIRPVYIEFGARIAQAIVFTSDTVDNLYNGQFQNDKQRK